MKNGVLTRDIPKIEVIGIWRAPASARTDATPNGGAWIRWMGRQADRPLQPLVGVCRCEVCAEAE